MKLSRVTEANLVHCVQLANELVDGSAFARNGIEFDWDFAMEQGYATLCDGDYYSCVAQQDDDSYVGFVLGSVQPFYFNRKLIGIEDAWYVRPGTRERTKIAMALMRSFMRWCMETKGAVHVQCADTASTLPLAVDRLYRHMGFKRYGAVYAFDGSGTDVHTGWAD